MFDNLFKIIIECDKLTVILKLYVNENTHFPTFLKLKIIVLNQKKNIPLTVEPIQTN